MALGDGLILCNGCGKWNHPDRGMCPACGRPLTPEAKLRAEARRVKERARAEQAELRRIRRAELDAERENARLEREAERTRLRTERAEERRLAAEARARERGTAVAVRAYMDMCERECRLTHCNRSHTAARMAEDMCCAAVERFGTECGVLPPADMVVAAMDGERPLSAQYLCGWLRDHGWTWHRYEGVWLSPGRTAEMEMMLE